MQARKQINAVLLKKTAVAGVFILGWYDNDNDL